MTAPIGVGLVGYGGIGRVHALCYRMLPLMYPDLPQTPQIVVVASGSAASAQRAQRELGNIVATTQLDELLAHPAVSLVDCCAPTGDHARIAAAVIAAGKTLYCEKPLAVTGDEAAQLAALAAQHNVVGGVHFHFRQIPAIQEAHRRISAGMLGAVYSFHLRYYRSSNITRDRPVSWRFDGPGSGVLQDLGSHMIDLVLHLLGPITTIAAHTRTVVTERPNAAGQRVPIEADDIAWLELELADGGRGSIEVSKMVPGAADDVRVEVYGAQGTLMLDARDPNQLYISENATIGGQWISTLNRTSPSASISTPESPTGTLQWHAAAIASFLTALHRGSAPTPSLADAAQVQRVIDAALRSVSRSGVAVRVAPYFKTTLGM